MEKEYVSHDYKEKCENCGFDFGYHRVKDVACPLPELVYSTEVPREWANTTFKEIKK